jgi:GNAT superfamily N-acetyltransferase
MVTPTIDLPNNIPNNFDINLGGDFEIEYKKHASNKYREINRFYKQHKLNVSASGNDVAYYGCHNGIIVAITLIQEIISEPFEESNSLLLRSLFVDPRYRSHFVGSNLVKYASSDTTSELITLCAPHLTDFYRRFGFRTHSYKHTEQEHKLPNHLKKLAIKKGLTLLVRPSC